MSEPRAPKRTIGKSPKQSLKDIVQAQMELLSVIATQRLFDRDELNNLRIILDSGVTLDEQDSIEAPKPVKQSTAELLSMVTGRKPKDA